MPECVYCGSLWRPGRYHPSGCAECGAPSPELLSRRHPMMEPRPGREPIPQYPYFPPHFGGILPSGSFADPRVLTLDETIHFASGSAAVVSFVLDENQPVLNNWRP
jgi:hypothetical protein